MNASRGRTRGPRWTAGPFVAGLMTIVLAGSALPAGAGDAFAVEAETAPSQRSAASDVALATTAAVDVDAIVAEAPRTDDGGLRVMVAFDVPEAVRGGVGTFGRAVERAAVRATGDRVEDELRERAPATTVDRHLDRLPYLAVTVAPDELDELAATPGVLAVTPDVEVELALDTSVPLVGASKPVPTYTSTETTGTGWAIAVVDTGVETSHPFLGGDGSNPTPRLVAEACFSSRGDCPDGANSSTATGAGGPLGDDDHGTHVAGIAIGSQSADSPAQGVAPQADLIAIQAFSELDDGRRVSYVSDLTASLTFVHDLPAETNVAAVNLSLGAAATDTCNAGGTWNAFSDVVNDLRARGVLTIAAAGNGGNRDRIGAPACLANVVAVGETDNADEIAWFSDISEQVDVVAPGVGIDSSILGGLIAPKSGTSMSTPHVAGAVALLRQAAPDADIDSLLTAAVASETLVDDERIDGSITGLPRLDLPRALTALPGATGGPSTPTGVTAVAGDG